MSNRAGARKKTKPCFNCDGSGDVSIPIPCPGCRTVHFAYYDMALKRAAAKCKKKGKL